MPLWLTHRHTHRQLLTGYISSANWVLTINKSRAGAGIDITEREILCLNCTIVTSSRRFLVSFIKFNKIFKQVIQLSQRDRAAGWVTYGQLWKMKLGYDSYGYYRSIFNGCDVFGQKSNQIRWKTQNKGYYAVQGHSRSSRSVPIESP